MALTFNLPSQIVVQTAAQWAVDATVYSNKRILVTSDAYYGSTDQRKFKIADGTQTWSQLDYFPLDVALALTLQQVIDNGNNLNGLMAQSNDTFSKVYVEDGDIDLYYNNGSVFSRIILSALGTQIKHTNQIDLNAPLVTFLQGYFTGMDNNFLAHLQQTYTLFAFAGNRKGSKLFMDADQIYSFWENTLSGVNGKVLVDTTNTKLEHTNLIELTAPSVTKNGSEVITSANITQVITNGVTDKAPSEDAVYDALALKLDANNAAVTNARNRKYFAYDNTTYTYTGATGDTILKTILIPGGTMGINSTLELFANFIKSGTAGNPGYGVYIGTSASALSGGNLVQYIQPGVTFLQSGIWVRLSTKNSQTSINTKGLSQVAPSPQTSQTIPINNRAFNWASDLYVHIYATAANAADTQGIQDYQMYIDNP